MKRIITVSELKRQLEEFEKMGWGDAVVWYRDERSMDYQLEEGVWDCDDDPKYGKAIALA